MNVFKLSIPIPFHIKDDNLVSGWNLCLKQASLHLSGLVTDSAKTFIKSLEEGLQIFQLKLAERLKDHPKQQDVFHNLTIYSERMLTKFYQQYTKSLVPAIYTTATKDKVAKEPNRSSRRNNYNNKRNSKGVRINNRNQVRSFIREEQGKRRMSQKTSNQLDLETLVRVIRASNK